MDKNKKLIQNLNDIGVNKELILKNDEDEQLLKADSKSYSDNPFFY